MKRVAILAGTIVSMLMPGVASGAALVPIAAGDGEAFASEPIFVTAPSNDERIFIVERGSAGRPGAIRVFENGAVKPQTFLTIDNISQASERGLLIQALRFRP